MLKANTIIVRTPFYPFVQKGVTETFQQQVQSATFKEALFLGSPNLYEEFAKAGSSLNEATKLSLYKYFLRMSYRCTPFGMFSGVSAGVVSECTSFKLAPQQTYLKHTRPDNHFINVFIHKALVDESLKQSVSWYSNNTAYQTGNSIRYVEYRLHNYQRTHHLAKVESSPYLNSILQRAKTGATIHELTLALISLEIPEDEARAFIDELIDSRLILSELEPVVTGQEPYLMVLAILEKYESGKPYATFLKKIIDQIEYLDTQPPGAQISLYQDVLKLVKEWDGTYDSKLVFQSDLCKPAVEMQVSASVLNEMQKAISFLALLNEAPVYTNLNKFKEEFSKRYENAEVSMLEVLDTESGVGYPTGIHANGDRAPLLNGLHFPIVSSAIEYKVRPWQKVLMKEYQECIAKGKIELVVTDALFAIDKKKIDASKLADSLYTICSLLGTSEELRTNDFSIDYKGSSGPSAANLLGRFCYLDSEIQSITEKLIQQEEQLQPDKIFAEIVHLAQSRVGNVLIRPAFRKYEIPILTIASVDVEHTIELSDILISLRNNKIVLRSKKFGKEILPRNSTAHNYSNDTVPYYYFLCDLQQQDSAVRLNWDWGLLNEFKFLPRIKYGRVILSKARWTLEEKDLSVSAKQSESEFRDKINSYRKDNNLPQWVILAQGDNQLPLDLEDTLSLKIVRQELARNKKIILEECLFQESNLLVEGPEGKFTNEIIIPWSKVKTTNDSRTVVKQEATVQRDFMPGTSWHYLKIYCGVKTGDQILSEIIKPLADELIKENTISQWFLFDTQIPIIICVCGLKVKVLFLLK
ncbi:MAG: lantibiotic dehydratase [Flammeovirgaceae bacterium]|nr:lantibiotic dehydratase [Flammeovirgaceae bacterium]